MNSYYKALKLIENLIASAKYAEAIEIINLNLARFPNRTEELLACAYDVAQKNPDKSRFAQYQSRYFDFGIRPGDRVLDMGSGHIPFPLATHLADISISDNQVGRAGVPFKHQGGKPVFECNIEKTPFADKEFDFVYCSHVLEHANNPSDACRELMRIGKRGYIECPTRGKDLFFAAALPSNHRWAVECINGILVFNEYSEKDILGTGNSILQKMNSSPRTRREKCVAALDILSAECLNVMLLWDNSFEFKVCKQMPWPASVHGPSIGENFATQTDVNGLSCFWLARKKIARCFNKLRSKIARILESKN